MARLSVYHDGLRLDPLFSYCTTSLIHNAYSEQIGINALVDSGSRKRKRSDSLSDLLALLKGAAIDPSYYASAAERGWRNQILRARKAMFKKQRTHECETSRGIANQTMESLIEMSGRPDHHDMLGQPVRKSHRTLLKLGDIHHPRIRIPIGPLFQADVPDWTDSPKDISDDKDDLRWLGTKIWPIEGLDRQTSEEAIGKGRKDLCACTSPGSMNCIRFHVNTGRLHLESDLGSAFFHLGFDGMGEEVSKFWRQEEQIKFDDLVRLNPISEGKNFWGPALKYFTDKSRKDIVSYYFNVFVLRWMSIRTRFGSMTVESDDDV